MEEQEKFFLPLGRAMAIVLSPNRMKEWTSVLQMESEEKEDEWNQLDGNSEQFLHFSTFSNGSLDRKTENQTMNQNSIEFGLKSIWISLKREKEGKENLEKIILILLEKIIVPKEQLIIYPFLTWVSTHLKLTFVLCLKEMLRRAEIDKKRTLALLLLVSKTYKIHSSFIQTRYSERFGVNNNLSEETMEWIEIMKEYIPLLDDLSNIIINQSIKEGIHIKATRLTITCSDLFFSILSSLPSLLPCLTQSEFSSKSLLRDIISRSKMIGQVVSEMIKWNKDIRPLFTIGLVQIERILRPFSLHIEENDEEIIKIFEYISLVYFPRLIENDKERKEIFKEVIYLLGELKDPTSPQWMEMEEEDRERSQNSNTNILISITLILGILKQKDFEKVVSYIEKECYSLLPRLFRSHNEENETLSIQIFQQILGLTTTKENVEEMIYPMMQLLQSEEQLNDSASKAAIGFIAQFASKFPEQILPEIFNWIDATQSARRANALKVITELLRIHSQFPQKNDELGLKLSFHLLKRLGDEDISLRLSSSVLFSTLSPHYTIPPLVKNCCLSRDGRVYNASERALLNILSGHKDITESIGVLLDCLRFGDIIQPSVISQEWSNHMESDKSIREKITVQDPSSIGSQHISKVSEEDLKEFCERVFRLIPQWSKDLPNHVWESLIPSLVIKFFSDPQESIVLSFMTKISDPLGRNSHILLPLVVDKLHNQFRLDQEIVDKSSTDTETLLFERVRPLLLLRLLPISSFTRIDEEVERSLILELRERIQIKSEFLQVKKLSSEILARFNPSIIGDMILSSLKESLLQRDISSSKIWLFGLCNLLLIRYISKPNENSQEATSRWWNQSDINGIAFIFFNVLDESQFVDEEFNKLQLGIIDCMGLLIQIFEDGKFDGSVLSLVMQRISDNMNNFEDLREKTSMIICLLNILIQSTKTCSIQTLKIITKHVLPQIYNLACGNKSKINHLVQSTSIHVLFTFAFYLKSEIIPFRTDLFEIAMNSIESNHHPSVRLNGLKLIGVLLYEMDDSIDPSSFVKLQILLESIANIDSSEEARKIAEKYLNVMGLSPDSK